MALNVFGCPNSSLATHKRAMNNESMEDNVYHSCGIWPQASLINHSCTCSARRSFIGDMMVVRATGDLEPGDEVTFWYQIPHFKANMRDKLKGWGFVCDCALCQDAKQTKATVKKERTKLRAALTEKCNSPVPSHKAMERLIDKLEATYAVSPDLVPRLGHWDAQMQVARIYAAKGNMDQAFKSACKVLVFLDFSLDDSKKGFEIKKWGMVLDYLIDAFMFIGSALIELKALASAKKAYQYAKTVYRIVVGEDETFEKTYEDHVV